MIHGSAVYIYALHDPSESSQRVYVGMTKNPAVRMSAHCKPSESSETSFKARWVLGLRRRGVKPAMVLLETATSDTWKEAEQFWIASLRAMGVPLVNSTDGGEGMWGYRLPVEHREAWSAERRQRPLRSDNKTGFKGVTQANGKFVARIRMNSTYHNIGTYKTTQEAATAYDKVARKHFKDYALNFPLPGERSARPGVVGQAWDLANVPVRELGAKRTKSGVRGISWHSTASRWAVEVKVDGRRRTVGRFKSLDEAVRVLERCQLDPDYARSLATEDKRLGGVVIPRPNKTGFRGVKPARHGRYVARVCHQRRDLHLGTFDTPEQAARAYDHKAFELYGGKALLNFKR